LNDNTGGPSQPTGRSRNGKKPLHGIPALNEDPARPNQSDFSAVVAVGRGSLQLKQPVGRNTKRKKLSAELDPYRPKKPAGGAFGVFLMEHRALKVKVASDLWKAMTDAERYPYMEKYNQKHLEYQKAMKAYLPPNQFSDGAVPGGGDPPVENQAFANCSMQCEDRWRAAIRQELQILPDTARASICGQLQPRVPVLPSAIHRGQTHQSRGSATQPNPPIAPRLLSDIAAISSAPPESSVVFDSSTAASSGYATCDSMCAVCLECPADTAVVPCGHMCGCNTCMQSIRGSPDAECPICRGPMTSTIRIYKN